MTIKDIARESGYAISTVSRALNGHPDVSPEARKRIQEIVAKNGFVPNANARRLKSRQGKAVAFIVKGTQNLFFATMMADLQRMIAAEGYATVIRYLQESENEVALAARLCRELKPRGIIFLGGDAQLFEEGFHEVNVPCVLVTAFSEGLSFENLSTVSVDDRKGAEAGMDLLLDSGHRRTLILGGDPAPCGPSRIRLLGCTDSLEKHGLAFDPELYCLSDFNMAAAHRSMLDFLDRGGQMDSVFAFSDSMAIGAMRALADRGFTVPDDVSVLGFDGTPLIDFCIPRLSSVRQPTKALAAACIRCLVDSIRDKKPAQHLLFPAELVLHDSVHSL